MLTHLKSKEYTIILLTFQTGMVLIFNDILFSLERQHYTVFPVTKPSSDVFCCETETEKFKFVYFLISSLFTFSLAENVNFKIGGKI